MAKQSASKSKKLNIGVIEKENKIYEEKVKVDLSNGYYVNIYKNFSPIKINELVREILTDRQRAEESGIDFTEINMKDWGYFNIIYKFSDLGIPSDIKSKVDAFIQVMNFKDWTKILSAFPKESIDEIIESLEIASNNLEEYMKKEFGNTNELTTQES